MPDQQIPQTCKYCHYSLAIEGPLPPGRQRRHHKCVVGLVAGKQCTVCKEFKLFVEFDPAPTSRFGYHAQCISCREIARGIKKGVFIRVPKRERLTPEQKRLNVKQRDRAKYRKIKGTLAYFIRERNARLQLKFGIGVAEYECMWREQKGVCAICVQPETHSTRKNGVPDYLSVDHDHQSGKIRGLLCRACNIAISAMKDRPYVAENARLYLLKHSQMALVG